MGFVFRFLALLALAIAVVGTVTDAARAISSDGLVWTPLAGMLGSLGLDPYPALVAFGETRGIGAVWEPLVAAALSAPAILVFVGLALIFYAVGYRRPRGDRLAWRG